MSLDKSRDRSHEETLSALMDNEADELELRRLLKDLPGDPELAETWKRFHLTRSVLHNEEMLAVSSAATSRILVAIAAEPSYEASRTGKVERKPRVPSVWLETAGRLAIAASVALAVFAGLQTTMFAPGSELPVAATETGIETDPSVQVAVNQEVSGFDAEAQRRLNDYIRGVSIQYGTETGTAPEFNILQDSQLIRQVNQIEVQPGN
ncbi:MAG: hypothetical protein A3H44_01655 [Gammaproteobacteria bacterium RIFCSPLOWO2_02_FULL_57_10]|nr:MAG: hypothetical protein A3H44_01655 [Gammaproteobacteria bacterium RIFCSPLOWO2_02_FULL_57_10]